MAVSPPFCSNCGFSLPPGAGFCPACRTPVKGSEPGVTPAAVSAEPPAGEAARSQAGPGSEPGAEADGESKGTEEESLGAATKSCGSSCLLILGGIGLLLIGLPLIGLSFGHGDFEPPLFGLGVLATLVGIALIVVCRNLNSKPPPSGGGTAGN